MSTNSPTDAEAESDTEAEAFVAGSRRRTAVLGRLVDGPAAASEVATNRSVSVAGTKTVTDSLSVANAETTTEELRDRGLVELLETDEKRAYSLTAKGERVVFSLERKGEL